MCVIGISVSFAAWPTSAVRCRFRLVVLAMSVCRINQLLTRLIVCGHCCVCVCTPAVHCPQMSDCNVTKGVWRVHSSIQQFCSDLCLWPTGSTVLAHCQWQQDELRLRLKQLAARFSYLCTSKTAEVHSMLRRLVIKIRLHHFINDCELEHLLHSRGGSRWFLGPVALYKDGHTNLENSIPDCMKTCHSRQYNVWNGVKLKY